MDDIATPDALADWLRSRDLLPDGALVDAGSFVRARALRRVLRALASRNAHGSSSDDELRVEFATLGVRVPLRFALGERGDLRLAPADRGVNGALAEILSRVFEAQTSGEWRRLKSCPGPHCGWLFYDASRNASRGGARCRSAGTGRRPRRTGSVGGRRREIRVVRHHAGVEASSAPRQRSARHGPRARGRDGCSRRSLRGRHHRERSRDGAGDRAHPGLGAFGAGGVVRHSRAMRANDSPRSTVPSTRRSPASGSTARRP